MVGGWNATGVAYGGEMGLHEWIERQAERTPELVAVRSEARGAELRGAGPGVRTSWRSTCGGRGWVWSRSSASASSCSLGWWSACWVLKAGGVRAARPGYPRSASRSCWRTAAPGAADAGAPAGRLPRPGPVLALDAEWVQIASRPEARPPVAGTTGVHDLHVGLDGQAKGAMNTHRGIVNRLLWMQEAYGLDARDRVLQKTPFSFDVSVWEFFWPLMTGARLVMARPERAQGPGYLAGLIASEGITTLHFVPSMLRSSWTSAGTARCATLRRVIASGEALPASWLRRFCARLGGRAAQPLRARPRRRSTSRGGRAGPGRRRRCRSGGRSRTRRCTCSTRTAAGAGGGARRAVHRRRAGWRAATWTGRS